MKILLGLFIVFGCLIILSCIMCISYVVILIGIEFKELIEESKNE